MAGSVPLRKMVSTRFISSAGAKAAPDEVVRPEDLGQSAELGEVAWLPARVSGGEASVARRMPVLGGDDQVEAVLQPVGDGDDLVAARNRQRAARQEVVLDVDEDQR